MPGFDKLIWALFYAGISTRKIAKYLKHFYEHITCDGIKVNRGGEGRDGEVEDAVACE